MKRILSGDVPKKDGAKVKVSGWIRKIRGSDNLRFLILRDMAGEIQLILKKGVVDEELLEKTRGITEESVIAAEGTVKINKEAPGGLEIVPEKLEILSEAEAPLPIDFTGKVNTGLDKRLDNRFLDLRNRKISAIFKIQSEICKYFREFFIKEGFTEFWPPEIIESAPEGGAELFSVEYFDRKAYMAQSPELYKELCTGTNLERVFSIAPVWRAEKHDTHKHLNEVRQMDIEVAFADQFSIMEYLEKAVKYVVKNLLKNCPEAGELNPGLEVPKVEKMSYKETVEKLKKDGFKIDFGEDLSSEAEKRLAEIYGKNTLILIHSWPRSLKPFYIMPGKSGASEGFDADLGGSELASGGQRVHRPDILEGQLKEKGLEPEEFRFFLDALKFGIPPHAGWSIGLERFTMYVCNLKNIREACMYPRDRERLTP
ncbi:MAG: aspartate--tRNA(Asn) ligase [archaeon]|nr:MAG: aspartate--tRNA(Asn) ligase [archaeon]